MGVRKKTYTDIKGIRVTPIESPEISRHLQRMTMINYAYCKRIVSIESGKQIDIYNGIVIDIRNIIPINLYGVNCQMQQIENGLCSYRSSWHYTRL